MLLFVEEEYEQSGTSPFWDMLHHFDIPYWIKPLSHLQTDERAFHCISAEFRPSWQREWFWNNEYEHFFLETSSIEMRHAITSNRVTVLMDITNAPPNPFKVDMMARAFTKYGIHHYQVRLLTSNLAEHHKFYPHFGYSLWMDYLRMVVVSEAVTDPDRVVLPALHTELRPHKHLFQNANPYRYRLALLLKLMSLGIADQGLWSLHNNTEDYAYEDEYHRLSCLHEAADEWWPDDERFLLNSIERLWKAGPVTLDDYPWTDSRPCYITSQLYKDTYFSIISETWFKQPDIRMLSEKPARSIIQHHPFVLLAAPGALRSLRELGYQTFHPYIDESYDDELDPHKRMALVVKAVQKLCEMSLGELHAWYHGPIFPILEHNYQRIMDRNQSELHGIVKQLQTHLGR